jgi:hypothetical protein
VHLAAQDAYLAADRPVRWLAVFGHLNPAATSEDRPDGFIGVLGRGELVIILAVSPWKGYVALKETGQVRPTWLSIVPPLTPLASWPPAKRLTSDKLLDLVEEFLPPGSRLARDDIGWRWEAKPSDDGDRPH